MKLSKIALLFLVTMSFFACEKESTTTTQATDKFSLEKTDQWIRNSTPITEQYRSDSQQLLEMENSSKNIQANADAVIDDDIYPIYSLGLYHLDRRGTELALIPLYEANNIYPTGLMMYQREDGETNVHFGTLDRDAELSTFFKQRLLDNSGSGANRVSTTVRSLAFDLRNKTTTYTVEIVESFEAYIWQGGDNYLPGGVYTNTRLIRETTFCRTAIRPTGNPVDNGSNNGGSNNNNGSNGNGNDPGTNPEGLCLTSNDLTRQGLNYDVQLRNFDFSLYGAELAVSLDFLCLTIDAANDNSLGFDPPGEDIAYRFRLAVSATLTELDVRCDGNCGNNGSLNGNFIALLSLNLVRTANFIPNTFSVGSDMSTCNGNSTVGIDADWRC